MRDHGRALRHFDLLFYRLLNQFVREVFLDPEPMLRAY